MYLSQQPILVYNRYYFIYTFFNDFVLKTCYIFILSTKWVLICVRQQAYQQIILFVQGLNFVLSNKNTQCVKKKKVYFKIKVVVHRFQKLFFLYLYELVVHTFIKNAGKQHVVYAHYAHNKSKEGNFEIKEKNSLMSCLMKFSQC